MLSQTNLIARLTITNVQDRRLLLSLLATMHASASYPSGRTVSYSYDDAGRTNSFTGYLGNVSRTYSTGIVYSPFGGISQEQFGTDAAIYNKSLYNSRGQLSEIRVGTAPNNTGYERGAIINQYSFQCWGAACNGTDNNGNLKKQEVYIPNGQGSDRAWYQQYDYDNLNRLQRVHEYTINPSLDWQQEYVYDRWGNRTIHQSNTWGPNIPKPNFGVNSLTNQLTAPSGSLSYDAAGNLTNDNYPYTAG